MPTARAKPPLPPARVRERSAFAHPPLPSDLGFAAKLFAEVDRFGAPRSESDARAQFAPAHALPKPSLAQELSPEPRVIVAPQPFDLPRYAEQSVTLPPSALSPSAQARRPPSHWARSVAIMVGLGVLLGLATRALAW